MSETKDDQAKINDEDFFKIQWTIVVDEVETNVGTVDCIELIKSWSNLSEDETNSFLEAIDNEKRLCPDITTF